jgi:OOP family OmpA-OmpF porin
MNIRNILLPVLLFSFSSSVLSADALDKPWYIGGGVGQSEADDACGGISNCDDTDTGWKLFGGYRFTQYVAIEAGYVDFGEYSGSSGGISASAEATGVTAHVVGTLPLHDRFSLIGRLGTIYSDVDVKASGFGITIREDDQSFAFAAGVGAEVNITDQFSLRAEYELFKDVGDDNSTGEDDVYLASLSAVFRF